MSNTRVVFVFAILIGIAGCIWIFGTGGDDGNFDDGLLGAEDGGLIEEGDLQDEGGASERVDVSESEMVEPEGELELQEVFVLTTQGKGLQSRPVSSVKVEIRLPIYPREGNPPLRPDSLCTAVSNSFGVAKCMVPVGQGFVVYGYLEASEDAVEGVALNSDENHSAQSISAEQSTRLAAIFPDGIPLVFSGSPASIHFSGVAPGIIWIRASAEPPAKRIFTRDRNACIFQKPTGDGTFAGDLEVSSGSSWYCSAYDSNGNLLQSLHSGHEISAGEVWQCQFSLPDSASNRDYFFTLIAPDGFTLNGLEGLFQLKLLNPENGAVLNSQSFAYEASRIYQASVPVNFSVEASLSLRGLSTEIIEINRGNGKDSNSPHIIHLANAPSIRFLGSDFPEMARSSGPFPIAFQNGWTSTGKVRPVTGTENHHELIGKFGQNTTSFRIGKQLFKTNLKGGQTYLLPHPAIQEITLPEVKRVRLTVNCNFWLKDPVMIQINHADALWHTRNVDKSDARSFSINLELPLGRSLIHLWHGMDSHRYSKEVVVLPGNHEVHVSWMND